jgi:RHS repeat-associated protein
MSDSWDPNGNTVQSGANQYGYDSENRLLSLNRTAANYVYDGDGQLVQKTVQGVTSTYFVDDLTPAGYTQIAEERVAGSTTKSYVYGLQRISMRDASGLHYYGYDAHSGVRLLMDGSGNVTDTWDYDAFGNAIARTGTTANDFTYRGEQMESALGMQYLRARYYGLNNGRFVQADALEGSESDPSTLNRYVYTGNQPTRYSDPSGYCSDPDPGSRNARLCLETFIPFKEVRWSVLGLDVYWFAGDDRGFSADSGQAYRTHHYVKNLGRASADGNFRTGISRRMSDGVTMSGSAEGIKTEILPNGARLAAASRNRLGPPLTPAIHYDLTITLLGGRLSINGERGQFPAFEVWLYTGTPPCKQLALGYDPTDFGRTPLDLPLSDDVSLDATLKCASPPQSAKEGILFLGRPTFAGGYEGIGSGALGSMGPW